MPDNCPTCGLPFEAHVRGAGTNPCPICGKRVDEHEKACENGEGWYRAAVWYRRHAAGLGSVGTVGPRS